MSAWIKTGSAGLFIVVTVCLRQPGAQPEENPADEISARGPIPFAVYDKNGDGVISEDEFYSVREARMSKRIDEGRPMRGAANAPAFSDFDTDKDGLVNPDELVTGQQARMQDGGCIEMGQGRGMGGGMGRNRPDFSEYDQDGDGYILETEFYEARNNRISEPVKQR